MSLTSSTLTSAVPSTCLPVTGVVFRSIVVVSW